MTLTEQMTQLAKQAKAASRDLSRLTTADKNACLLAMADALEEQRRRHQRRQRARHGSRARRWAFRPRCSTA